MWYVNYFSRKLLFRKKKKERKREGQREEEREGRQAQVSFPNTSGLRARIRVRRGVGGHYSALKTCQVLLEPAVKGKIRILILPYLKL